MSASADKRTHPGSDSGSSPKRFPIHIDKDAIEQSVSSCFEKQAAKYPQHMAIKVGSDATTYEALNSAANRLAHGLIAISGDAQEPVGLLFRTNLDVFAAMMAVFKADKVAVPMDSAYPANRLSYILRDTGARIVMTDARNIALARELAPRGVKVVDVRELGAGMSGENLGRPISPGALACILYTSGSTGDPKGVMFAHRQIVYSAITSRILRGVTPADRMYGMPSFAFAGSLATTMGALLNGAAVVMLSMDDSRTLADILNLEEITIASATASMLSGLLKTLTGAETFPRVRLFSSGSEPLLRGDAELYQKLFPAGPPLLNVLGATETGHVFRQYVIDATTRLETDIVPVGYAVGEDEVLLLDDDLNPVVPGEAGQIAVKSDFLSPGYWGRPELTDAVFKPDPAGSGKRIYLTGDQGCMLPDGCLVCLGRKDFQVKIRAFRVELAEVELALRSDPAVRDTVVLARADRSGERRLVAYIVPVARPAPSVSQLRRALMTKLPEYMVPSAFVMLDKLPLAPNGKLDRRALPEPGHDRPNLEVPFVAPRTPVEKTLAAVWAEVLGVEAVGIHDDFFELGGHSLLAAQVVSRIFKALGVDLPVQALFDAPVLADFALAVTQQLAGHARQKDLEEMLDDIA